MLFDEPFVLHDHHRQEGDAELLGDRDLAGLRPGGPGQQDDQKRAQDQSHGSLLSSGRRAASSSGTSTSRPSTRNELVLPWMSRFRLALTPPSSTSSMTKLSACRFGSS